MALHSDTKRHPGKESSASPFNVFFLSSTYPWQDECLFFLLSFSCIQFIRLHLTKRSLCRTSFKGPTAVLCLGRKANSVWWEVLRSRRHTATFSAPVKSVTLTHGECFFCFCFFFYVSNCRKMDFKCKVICWESRMCLL